MWCEVEGSDGAYQAGIPLCGLVVFLSILPTLKMNRVHLVSS